MTLAYLRITNNTGVLNSPGPAADVPLVDLGYVVPSTASNWVISEQFSPEELQNSADLKDAVSTSLLVAQVNLDGVWTTVAAGDYNGDDVYAAYANIYEITNTIDNQRLVNDSDCSDTTAGKAQLHKHDARYYTESEMASTTNGSSGASLVATYSAGWTAFTGVNVQLALNAIDALFELIDLDYAYSHDPDGVLNVDDLNKNLDLRSDNVNDILVSRKSGVNIQTVVNFDVSANFLYLGAQPVTGLARVDVQVLSNLFVDGNIQFTGTITDTTVDEQNITNAAMHLRSGATTAADAFIYVERGTAATDASLKWNEGTQRWKAGLQSSEETIALLEHNEVVTGVWEFQGSAATDPSLYLTQKTVAASTKLGTSTQIPFEVINGQLATYDKTNSRNKWLSVSRNTVSFLGRDHDKNIDEYLRIGGGFVSSKTGFRVPQACTILSITLESASATAWTAKVQRNYNTAVDLLTKATGGARGVQDTTLNVDLAAGDTLMVYMQSSGVSIDRPIVTIEYAYRY